MSDEIDILKRFLFLLEKEDYNEILNEDYYFENGKESIFNDFKYLNNVYGKYKSPSFSELADELRTGELSIIRSLVQSDLLKLSYRLKYFGKKSEIVIHLDLIQVEGHMRFGLAHIQI